MSVLSASAVYFLFFPFHWTFSQRFIRKSYFYLSHKHSCFLNDLICCSVCQERKKGNGTKIETVIGCIIRLIALGCTAIQTCGRNEKKKRDNNPVAALRFSYLSLQKHKKISLRSLPAERVPPQPSTKCHYTTLKWLLCFSPSVDVKDPRSSSTKVQFRDWAVVDVLIQRCS